MDISKVESVSVEVETAVKQAILERKEWVENMMT
jgi:hypothetical protein